MAGMAVWTALLLGVLLATHHPGDTGELPLPQGLGCWGLRGFLGDSGGV